MRPKTWFLSEQAEVSFASIGEWTAEHFGDRQSQSYRDLLIARCAAVANGLAHSQHCREVFAQDMPEDLKLTRAGQHYVVFVETEREIAVVDFVHQRMDLAGKVGET